MLHQRFGSSDLEKLLIPHADFSPYPRIDDRARWSSLDPDLSRAIVATGETLLGYDYPMLPATLFLEFSREGNRERYEKASFGRRGVLESLVLAECVEDRGRFLDDIVNGIWAICEETFWGIPGHLYLQRAEQKLPDHTEPVVDLFTAETGNLLSWTRYLLSDRLDTISRLIGPRMSSEIHRRILIPLQERDDFWWMGFHLPSGRRKVNNWNPWIASNWLVCALLEEQDQKKRADAVAKLMRAADFFIDEYPTDGGCDEGPSYWGVAGGAVYELLEMLWIGSGGKIDFFSEPLIAEIGRYIYRAHIADDFYLNFADAPAIVAPDPAIVYGFGSAIGDEQMMAFGRWLDERQGHAVAAFNPIKRPKPVFMHGTLRKVFRPVGHPALAHDSRKEPDAAPPYAGDVWLDQIEVVTARDHSGTAEGLFVGAKGGHNGESHNHNDVGTVVVYHDGAPLIADAGVETYTAKTFSDKRYEIWTMQSAYHTLLPTIDGIQQAPGYHYAASSVSWQADETTMRFSLELAGAYPESAGIGSWVRTVTLVRGSHVEITDEWSLVKRGAQIVCSLLSPSEITASGRRASLHGREFMPGHRSADGVIEWTGAEFTCETSQIPITDDRLSSSWGDHLNRLVLTSEDSPVSGEWRYRIAGIKR
jgi:hypothetical protein